MQVKHGLVVALVAGAWVMSSAPSVNAESAVAAPGDLVCTVRGTPRADLLRGTSGDDVICGFAGNDQLMGLGGDDVLLGDGGNDVLIGGAGNDVLRGASGNDFEFGGAGNDRLRNWAGADRLDGGAGNDHLRGGKGPDVIIGGPGRDLATYAGHTAGVSASIGGGADDGRRGEGDNIAADVENLRGSVGNDTLIGSPGANRLAGGGGNDRLTGLAGNDRLAGGNGRDVLNGRDGAGFVDELSCGGGAGDRALADMSDQVGTGCEDVVQNDPPTGITLSAARVAENRPVGTRVGALTAADPDAGDRHTFRLVAGAGSGGNGSFRVDGTTLETGAVFDFETKDRYSIRLRVTDSEGATFERSLTVTISDAFENQPPVAVDDTVDGTEDTPLELPVTGPDSPAANDTDGNGDALTVTAVSAPTGGTVSIAGGMIEFTPSLNRCLPETAGFMYTVGDGRGGTDTGQVNIEVACVDDFPVAVDDTATVAEDDAATVIPVLVNDTDVDGGARLIDSVTQPQNGTVTVRAGNEQLDYEPTAEYCNTLPGVDPDTFTYTLNGGSTATVSMTVTCADDPAVAVADTATVDEDAGPSAIDVLGNDQDPDTDAAVTAVTQPGNGTVVITGGGTGVTYEPNANYCNTQTGGSPDTFSYTISGGSTADVTVTVTCVDDLPVANDDTATRTEDDPTTAINVLANDTDVEGDPITITSATDPDHGTVVIFPFGAGLTYRPDVNYCNSQTGGSPDTFTYTVNGGDTASVAVTVTCVDDLPVANDDTVTVVEDDPAGAVDVLANDADVEGDPITIDTVTQPADGTVVVTGGGIGLTYEPGANYCNDPPGTTPDSFTYTVNGGDDATVAVIVTCVEDAAVANDDTATLEEDAAATGIPVLANDVDADGDPITITAATDPDHGTVLIFPFGAGLTYQPDANYCNSQTGGAPDTFSYTINGGDTATVAVTVTCVNDPSVANDDTATVLEDAGATAVNVLANDTDAEGDPITIGSVTQPANGTVVTTGGGTGVTYQPNANYCNDPPGTTPDRFTYTVNGGDQATVAVTVTCVEDPPVAVDDTATVLEDAAATAVNVLGNDTDVDGGPMVITAITQPANGTVVTTGGGIGLTYEPNPNYCNSQTGGSPDTFTYTITGGSNATVTVTVTCVDDPPVAVDDTATVLEDAAATAITVFVNDTDIDAGPMTINSVTQPGNGTVIVTGGGSGLTYRPNPNYCNTQTGGTADTFTYTLNGGSQANVAVTVTCVNDNPIADDETFTGANSAVGNTTFVVNDPTDGAPTVAGPNKMVTGDLLDGDSDVDGPGPLTIVAGTIASNDGGSVTIQADGDFTYTPVAGTGCTDSSDTFNYTVSDQNPAGPGPTPGTDTGTVTINLSGCVWYVSNNATGNAGTSSAPFDTLAQADTATPAGDVIFVFDGDNTTTGYNAGIALAANQQLIGEAANLVVGGVTLHTGVPANRPTITDTNADVVELASANTVTGVDIDPAGTGGGIAGGTGDTGGTISDVRIVDTAPFGSQPGLELDATSGTWNITTGLTVSTNGATGIRLNNAGTVNFPSAAAITITTAGAKALDATGATTNFGTGSVIDDLTVTGSTNGAVNLVATTGSLTLGDGTGTDLALTTTSGATAAFASTHTGTLTVNPFGTDNVSATGGPALDVTGPASLAFDDVDSSNSSTDGISLASFGGGTFSAPSGTIAGVTAAGGAGFDLDGGNAAVSFDGTITASGSGRSVEVSNRTGNTVDFNGLVTDNGTGINLTTNTGATVRFDGGITASTGANTAFNATSGGTIAVTDPNGATAPNNTLTTMTGTALNVQNTTIHADGLRFQSIAANGGANGIVLSNTGAGGLTVTGSGTAGSGGTIQNTTNRGASFISASNVSLSSMNFTNAGTTDLDADNSGLSTGDNLATNASIHLQTVSNATLTGIAISGGAEQGINGNAVSNFVLSGSSITNAGNEPDEDGIHFFNMAGTSSITNTTITSTVAVPNTTGGDDHLNLQMQSGTLNLTVSGGGVTNANKGSGYLFGIRGSANATIQFQNATSTGNFSGGIVADAFDSATMNLTVTNSTSSGNNDQLSVSAGDNSNVDVNASGNTLSSVATGDFVVVSLLGSALDTGYTLDARIQDNTISVANGLTADGIVVFNAGGSNLNVVISGNTMTYAGTQRAILLQGGQDGPSNLHATVTDNNIDIALDGAGNAVAGILAQSQVADPSGAGSFLCADLGGAGTLANTFTHSLGGALAAGDIRVRQRFAGNVRLPSYGGGATDTAAVTAYLNGRNNEVSASTATVDAGSFSGGAACTQPAP